LARLPFADQLWTSSIPDLDLHPAPVHSVSDEQPNLFVISTGSTEPRDLSLYLDATSYSSVQSAIMPILWTIKGSPLQCFTLPPTKFQIYKYLSPLRVLPVLYTQCIQTHLPSPPPQPQPLPRSPSYITTTIRRLLRVSHPWRVIGPCASTIAPHSAATADIVVVMPRHALSSNLLHAVRLYSDSVIANPDLDVCRYRPLCLYSYPHRCRCSSSS
jgi:hypothetical protein